MSRPDPAVTFLKHLGLVPILLPRADVKPLQLLSIGGKELDPLGELANAMVPEDGATLPPIQPDIQTAGQIAGTRSASVKLSVGLTLLGNILQAFTGQNLDVSAGYKGAKMLTFEFADPTFDKVDIVLLDRFLNRSDIHPDARHIETLMLEDRVAVITATVRTRKFVITALSDQGVEVAANVPVIQGIVGGNVAVGFASQSNTRVAYEGPTPVAFGVQAIKLYFDDTGHYTAFDPVKAGDSAVRALGLAAASSPTLVSVPGFARIGGGERAAKGGI